MTKPKPKPKPPDEPKPKAAPRSVSFHFDEALKQYLPRLEAFAVEHELDLGPAARELVKAALDRPTSQPSPTVGPELAGEVASVRDAVKALQLGGKMTLDEIRAHPRAAGGKKSGTGPAARPRRRGAAAGAGSGPSCTAGSTASATRSS